jgi:hypothetical protein
MTTTATTTATHPHIDVRQLIGDMWRLFGDHPGLYVAGALLVFVGSVLTVGIASAPLLVGYVRLVDRVRRGEPGEAKETLDGLASFSPAFITCLIQTLAIALGATLVVLPGLVIACATAYALWFVALHDLEPLPAIGASWDLARRNAPSLLLILLLSVALNLVGALTVVGLLASLPLSLILMTLGFHQLAPARVTR